MDGTGASIAIDPYLTPQEREELGHIAYFLTQLEALRARGILPDPLREAIAAEYRARRDTIEQNRRYEALLSAARGLRDKHLPGDALSCALKATQLAPERPEAWMLAIDLHARLHRYDEAIALATNASARFPAAASRLAELSHEREEYEAVLQKAAEQESQAHASAELSEELRSAIRQGRDADALELGGRLLQIRPGDLDVIGLLALVHTRLGQIDEALALYRELKHKDPANLFWTARISELEARHEPAHQRVTEYVRAIRDDDSATHAPQARPELLTVTWGGIAGEFLKEHWQKLILCLAVLLIVVSSTVGAHHLLGERLLWSRAGQCLLAVVYTALFAGFGAGLVRWGAQRAGRIMLLTTLAVVPVNFSLAGELRLLSLPTPSHLAIFAMVVIVLFPLCWLVVSSLQMKEDGLFPIAFFLLSAFDGTAARGVPFAWGFAALVAASVMFLCAIWGLCARLEKGDATEERRDFAYFALGLLTYAFLFFAYRSGVFVLRLIPREPPLMAIPTMFAGMAAVRTARTLPRFDKDPRRILMLRLGGLVLAGLAFALALARSPAPNALLSGNTLATAVIGFCLFATLMWLERQPQYLYLSFGALVVAYFGGYYFVRDLMEQVLLLLGHALGYRGRLPEPFKAINAIVFNLGLVWLWLFFRRRHEERLARHCHFIGLPLSIVACLISSLEPKAAVICMSAYVVLYALGTWFFAQPMLLYLCCATAAGAVGFAAWLRLGLVPGTWALLLVGIGLACWITARGLAARKIEEAYRRPLFHSALGMAAIALGLATVAVRPPSAIPIQAVAAYFVVSALCGLIMLDVPRRSLAYLAVGVAGAGYLLLFAHESAVPLDGIPAARLAIAAAAAGLVQVVLAQGATWFGHRRAARLGRSSRVELYASPLLNLGLFQVALALRACWPQLDAVLRAPDPPSLAALAVALALCSAALAVVTAFAYRLVVFASAVVLLGSAAYAAGILAGLMELSAVPLLGAMAVAIAALALALALCATGVDRFPRVHSALKLYRDPLLFCALSAVGVTWFLAAPSWSSFALIAVALALACAALVAVAGLEPLVAVAHGAIASALGVWLCIFEIVTHRAVASGPVYGLVVLTFALFLLLLGEVVKERESRRSRAFSRALPDFAQAAILVALGLVIFEWVNNLAVVASFLIAALAFLWLTRFRREASLVYASLSAATAAAFCLCTWLQGWQDVGFGLGWLALTAALLAFVFWVTGFAGRRLGAGALYVTPCHVMALLLALVVFELALPVRAFGKGAVRLAVSALLLNALVLALLTAFWRLPALTYAAIGAFVCAAYVTLFSIGEPDPAKAWILGLAAVVQALLFWTIGMVCRRLMGPGRGEGLYARPLFLASLWLTAVAVALAYHSPGTMLLVALAFLLMVNCLPSERWLYPAVAALGVSAYFGYLDGGPERALMWAAVLAAYVVWIAAISVQGSRPALCRRLGLVALDYEKPLFNAAVVFAALGLALRMDMSLRFADSWTAFPGLPPALGMLALLMLKAYPDRGWVHLAAAFLTLGVASLVDGWIESWPLWLLVAIVVANAWLAVRWVLERFEKPLCAWLGVKEGRYFEVMSAWSLGVFAVGALATAELVIVTILAVMFDVSFYLPAYEPANVWPAILLALVFAGVYLDAAARLPGLDWLLVGLLAVPPLIVWWLGVPSSPLVRSLRADPLVFEPLATALVGLGSVLAGRITELGKAGRRSWLLGNLGVSRLAMLEAHAWQAGVCLAGCAVVFTMGTIGFATVGTLVLVTATFAWIALEKRWASCATAASVAWQATLPYALLATLKWLGAAANPAQVNLAALAGIVAAFGLIAAAGRVRPRPSPVALESEIDDPRPLRAMAEAMEQIALLASGVAAAVVVAGLFSSGAATGDLVIFAGVSVLIGLTAVLVSIARRWLVEWPVYAAQAAFVGSYFYYRGAYPAAVATDALVLVLLGYLDFAIAEVMQRLRLNLYARPTLYFSLAMPLLPLALALWHGQHDDVSLFTSFATATFYGVACYRLQEKRLGYAAAVLYNAFLWIMWARVGWQIVDHPQFFLIPVGFSAILFAEVNRRELGHDYVNALRYLGLVTIYASLAVPIWQYQSFGAWLTLLLLSLTGIFVGIGLQVQSFLWLGLACFVLDVVYQVGRMGLENALAKWGIMLALGILLVLFVALNEKKGIVATMRGYYAQVRQWE